jgi:glycosyltransferase 2 family protein
MTKFLSIAVRLVVTVGLFAALLSRLDTGRIANILSNGSPSWFVLAVAALAATNPFNASRWRLILAGQKAVRPSVLLRILFVGWFFNQMLPTGIGGDAVRAWRCKLSGISLTVAIRSILLDRASGYIVLVAVYAISLPALLAIIGDPLQQRLLLLVLAAATFGLAALFLIDRLPQTLLRLRPIVPLASLSVEARGLFLQSRRAAPIFGLALVMTGLTILSADLAGRCVNLDLSFIQWLMIVPPVSLFQLLPVSLGGWGVREAALIVILGKLGIPGETALAASLCVGISQILVGLPGGLIWLHNWDIGDDAARLTPVSAGAVITPAGPVAELGSSSGKQES